MLHEPVNSLLHFVFLEAPEARKVVYHAIRNNTKGDCITHLFIDIHQAVYCIVERRVTANDYYLLITVAYKHIDKTGYAINTLALHKVILHIVLVECLKHLLPQFSAVSESSLRAIQYAPTLVCIHHAIIEPLPIPLFREGV